MWGFTHPVECEGKNARWAFQNTAGSLITTFLEERGLLGAFVDDYTRRSREGLSRFLSTIRSCPPKLLRMCILGSDLSSGLRIFPGIFPWHLFVSFVGPHDPFDPPAEYGEKYRDAEMPPATPANLPGKPAYLKDRIKDMTPEKNRRDPTAILRGN